MRNLSSPVFMGAHRIRNLNPKFIVESIHQDSRVFKKIEQQLISVQKHQSDLSSYSWDTRKEIDNIN